jgi:hypothetical protein
MPSANTKPWYLKDMTESLYLDPVSGEVAIRTGIAGNVNITGPVSIPGSVTIGALGAVDISQSTLPITGIVTVSSLPAVTQGTNPWIISGAVDANITGGNVNSVVTGTVGITGNIAGITALPAITGTVAVSSIPAITGTVGITGNIAGITALPAITGTVGVTGNIAGITSLPPITGTVNANITGGNVIVSGTVGVSGNIAGITALPPIGGNINVLGNIAGITALPPITGAVSITGNIAGITAPVTVTQGTTPWAVSGSLTIAPNSPVTIAGNNLDAFGRLRVSNPFTLFDSALNGERKYQFSSATATGGTVTFNYNANVRQLNVTSTSGSQVIRESLQVFPYQPGKSLLIMNSYVPAAPQANLRQRIGFFSVQNGVYFEQAGLTSNFVIRSSSTGAVVEDRVPQNLWNTDRLDGTGPSGITMNKTAGQIFYCDVEWLGAGTVRCGFVINGSFITCHQFQHANDPAYTTTYMGTSTLPVRIEITNTGVTTGPNTLQQICSTVISEGGYTPTTNTYAAGTGVTTVRLSTAGTLYPIVSLRLNSSYLNSVVYLAQVDILSPTVNYYRWSILKDATLTGATWASASSTTRVDVDTSATAVTGGIEIQSGYASSRETAQLIGTNALRDQLGRTLQGVSDTWTLALTATNNNADVLAQLGWQEIT